MATEEKKKRGPIIVETGADDPSTVSPIVDVPIEPETPEPPVMATTAMGDLSGAPDASVSGDAEPPPGPAAYVADKPTNFVEPFPVNADAAAGVPPATAPGAAAPAPINIGPVVTTERTKLSAEAKEGQAGQLAAAKAAEGIAGREGAQGVAKAEDLKTLAAEDERQKEIARRQEMEDRAREQAKYQAGLAERDRILNEAEQQSHKDYWSDKPAGARLISAFSSAVAEYAAVRSGSGHNGAQELIDKEMNRDDARKQAILKQAVYRAGLKGADAKEAYENGLMDLSLRKAAVLGKLADHRASVLAANGVPEAQIASDKLVNAAQDTRAKLLTNFGDQLNVKVHSSNQLQQEYKLKSALEAQKLAGGGVGGGRASAKMLDLASYGTQMRKDIDELRPLMKYITPDVLKKVQDNKQDMKTMEHASAIGAKVGRATIYARDPYEGLDENERRAMYLHDIVNQKAAVVLAGQGHQNHKDMADILNFAPSDNPTGITGKLQQYDDLAAGAMAGGGPYTQRFMDAKDNQRAAVEAAPATRWAGYTSTQRAQLVARARANPDAPGASQILALSRGQ